MASLITQQVGPGLPLANGIAWTQALAKAKASGQQCTDISVQIASGGYQTPKIQEYKDDAYVIPAFASNITLDGSGPQGAKARIRNTLALGMPNAAAGTQIGGSADKALIYVRGANAMLRGLVLEGGHSLSGGNNGAGVRYDRGNGLTVEDSIVRNCEDGMLLEPDFTPGAARGDVTIRRTHISECGFGGQAHILYCGPVVNFTLEDSELTGAVGQGNTCKIRADNWRLRTTLLSTGAGYNSYELDAMGGKGDVQWCTIRKLAGKSSQPKNCMHIYIEPQSKPVELNIQNNVFDLRDAVAGHPIILDRRVLYNGDGGIGLDGLQHAKGANYYLPLDGSQGEAMRDMTGIVDNNTILINPNQMTRFGIDPKNPSWKGGLVPANYAPQMCFAPNTPGSAGLPPGLVEGQSNRWYVVD